MQQRKSGSALAKLLYAFGNLAAFFQHIHGLILTLFQTIVASRLTIGQTLFAGKVFAKIIQLLRSTTIGDIFTIAHNAIQVVNVDFLHIHRDSSVN